MRAGSIALESDRRKRELPAVAFLSAMKSAGTCSYRVVLPLLYIPWTSMDHEHEMFFCVKDVAPLF